ncbi:MAG: dihydropteroate synthase [Cyclobacteriaceae bacterium]|nr:dihydropteroate synthase [Cyclobacteriaceae bacterium]
MAKDTVFSTKKTLNIKGSILNISTPLVMGILNTTPDSFFDGGKYSSEELILQQVRKMLEDGASIIDVGGYSSRPGANEVTTNEEINRTSKVIEVIINHFPDTIISIDTFRSAVAEAAIETGAKMVNDISAGSLDKDMFSLIGKTKTPYVMMHMRGTPQNMQHKTSYTNLMNEIMDYFIEKIKLLQNLDVTDIIIDPGFGFSKTKEQNFEILEKLNYFKGLGLPLLAGVSRKSMIYNTLGNNAEQALNGTSVLNTIALMNGAQILRVHDVKEAMECIQLFNTTYS